MSKMDHPFILKLLKVAQDPKMVYLYLEYMSQGDLMKILQKFKQVPRNIVEFYIA